VTNVAVIVGDDFGCEVLSMWGRGGSGTYGYASTPHLDALANGGTVDGVVYPGGLRFTRAYGGQLCSPFRAMFLTGRYPFRTGVGDIIRDDNDGTTMQGALNESEYTIAKHLKAHGYRTAAFGKWHLGNTNVGGREHPNRMGFNEYAGNLFNIDASSTYTINGTVYARGLYAWDQTVQGTGPHPCRTYHSTQIVNLALRWVRDQGSNPWFLYLPFYAAHSPFTNQSNTSPVRFNAPPISLYDETTWDHAQDSPSGTPSTQQVMHTFRAAIEALDTELGRLIKGLVALDPSFWTTTLVVFATDNGSPVSTIVNEVDPTYGAYPNRGKDTPYETGVWTALIAAGASVGSVPRTYDSIVSVVDLWPTISLACGIAVPDEYGGPPAIPLTLDGVSLLDVFTGNDLTPPRDTAYVEYFQPVGAAPEEGDPDADRTANEWAIIGGGANGEGRYKLLKPSLNGPLELYELTDGAGNYTGYQEVTNLTPLGDTSTLNAGELAAYNELVAARAALVQPA
jgi:arylsulfatase A-like enzyme